MKKIETRCTVREHPLNQDDKQFLTHDGWEVEIEIHQTIVFSLENGLDPMECVKENMDKLFYHDELFDIDVRFEDIYDVNNYDEEHQYSREEMDEFYNELSEEEKKEFDKNLKGKDIEAYLTIEQKKLIDEVNVLPF